jgi:hypothetical protein
LDQQYTILLETCRSAFHFWLSELWKTSIVVAVCCMRCWSHSRSLSQ